MAFLSWCEEVLKERFSKREWMIESATVLTDIEVNPNGWAVFTCSFDGETIWRMPLGWMDRRTLTLSIPRDAQLILVLTKTIEMFERWARAHLTHAYTLDPTLSAGIVTEEYPLLSMLEENLYSGAPLPVPVPKPDQDVFRHAARDLKTVPADIHRGIERRLRETQETVFDVIAVFKWKNYFVALADHTDEWLYSDAAIFVLNSDLHKVAQVFGKSGRGSGVTIDGDVFSLRRFLQVLKGAIEEANLDRVICFSMKDSACYRAVRLRLSEWLSFNIPDDEESTLFNWTLQSYAASAGVAFPFTDKTLQQEALWREFLSNAVDSRLRDSTY